MKSLLLAAVAALLLAAPAVAKREIDPAPAFFTVRATQAEAIGVLLRVALDHQLAPPFDSPPSDYFLRVEGHDAQWGSPYIMRLEFITARQGVDSVLVYGDQLWTTPGIGSPEYHDEAKYRVLLHTILDSTQQRLAQ